MALLHVFFFLRDKLGFRLGVAHVNYGIRGTDSDKDEKLVDSLCEQLKIPLFVLRSKGNRGKNEEFLRDIRYRFFERIRAREGFDTIATAHTEDDQAETVLIRLIRGAGPEGLAAMRPRNGFLIRPFLDIAKRDILEFLEREHIPFREDASNLDRSILRNRIRHELLPLLEKEYRPGIRKVLSRTARIFAKNAPTDPLFSHDSAAIPLAETPEALEFSRSAFLSLSEASRARELRRLYRLTTGGIRNPGESFVKEAQKLIGSSTGTVRIYISKRLKIKVQGDRVSLLRNF